MPKKKPTGGTPLSKPNVPKLEEEFLNRYVRTPLSFWDDGGWEIDESTDIVLRGQVVEIKMVKNKKKDVVGVIWYEPYDKKPDSRCEIKLPFIHRMLHPRDFEPDKDSFFYDDNENRSPGSKSSASSTAISDDANVRKDDDPTLPLPSSNDNKDNRKSSSSDEKSYSSESDGVDEIESESDSDADTETDDKEIVLTPFVKVEWKKGVIGKHVPLQFEGPINQESNVDIKKNGMANEQYFPDKPDPVQCFFAFLPITFFDKVAEWTQKN